MTSTLSAAMDLLYELQRCKASADIINESVFNLNKDDDFPPRIAATIGRIEPRIVDMLDLYFEGELKLESIATHMLYETGIIFCDGERTNLNNRKQFENLVEYIKARQA